MTEPFNPEDYLLQVELPRTFKLYDDGAGGSLEHIEGRILAIGGDESSTLELGSVELYYMRPDLTVDFISVADGEEPDLATAVEAVFDLETAAVKEQISRFYGEMEFETPDFLYIRRIQIAPQYRGRGIGERAMRAVLKAYNYPYCSLMIVKPFPVELREDDREETVEDQKQIAAGVERLTRFYHRLGFRQVVEGYMTYCTLLSKQPGLLSPARVGRAGQ